VDEHKECGVVREFEVEDRGAWREGWAGDAVVVEVPRERRDAGCVGEAVDVQCCWRRGGREGDIG